MGTKYNLFLDDVRLPYLNESDLNKVEDGHKHMASAYYYTKYEPFKNEKWVVVKTYNEFVEYITQHGCPSLVAFDHDLADEHYNYNNHVSSYVEKTGYDATKWLCEYCYTNNIKFPNHVVHSMNIIGLGNINQYITNYKKHIENV